MTEAQPVSVEAQRAALQARINYYLNQGYVIVAQTETTAQLAQPEKFGCLLAGLAVILSGLPVARSQPIYLSVDKSGRVEEKGGPIRRDQRSKQST
jgi:hypothetical protein